MTFYDDPLWRTVNEALLKEAVENIPPHSPAVPVYAGTRAVVTALQGVGTQVHDLRDLSETPIAKEDLRACVECGSYWFELKRDRGQDPIGLALGKAGSVVAYAGVLTCIYCGKRYEPMSPT